jgi:hypothetical protein
MKKIELEIMKENSKTSMGYTCMVVRREFDAARLGV